jgi:type III pantothenate kinase
MRLVVDIGNTNICFGLYTDDILEENWNIPTYVIKKFQYNKEIFKKIYNKYNIDTCIVSCVVPSIKSVFSELVKKYFNVTPLFVDISFFNDILMYYDNPEEIGIDRLVNVFATIKLYKTPSIVIDFGTATTFDIISDKNEFLGGVIAPGIKISSATLWEKTEKLPQVDIVKPSTVIGRNTINSMQSGIFYGFIGQVDEIISRIIKELEFNKEIYILATGGLAKLISPYSKYINNIDLFLTLKGLNILGKERNKECRKLILE